jgi:tripeptide aminopeptidase
MLNKTQLTNTFFELIKIDSPSGEEKKVAAYIIKYLKKLKVKEGKDKYGNVIAKVPGVGEPLLLCAHMDTVEPERGIIPVMKKDIISSKGETILAADDKAGIAVILETVKDLLESKLKHRPLELLFTREEETGCIGATHLNIKKLEAKEGIVMDSCRPLGHICLAAPFIYNLEIWVKGKSAHGGAFPEKGRNALVMAARALSEIKLGRLSKITTANIGIIKGGLVANSVPDEVYLKGDVRSHKLETVQKEVDKINKVFKKHVRTLKGSLKFKATLALHGYSYPRTDSFIKQIADINKKMKFKTVYEKSGGATDANVLAGKGIKLVDISYGGKFPHTTKETIKATELLRLGKFLSEFIRATS